MSHIHTIDCIQPDVIDLGDDGDRYVAYPTFTCSVTGESHKKVSDFDE